MPKAVNRVVVHHADRLHERVADRRANEFESALQEITAQRVRLGSLRRDLRRYPPSIDPGRSPDEPPDVGGEAAKLLLNREDAPPAAHRAIDLQPVANDPGILQQSLNPF